MVFEISGDDSKHGSVRKREVLTNPKVTYERRGPKAPSHVPGSRVSAKVGL